jgi:hypothetical protein
MQSVGAVVLVWQDVVGHTVDLKRAVLYTVRVSAYLAFSYSCT